MAAPRYPDALFLGAAVHYSGKFEKGRPSGILEHYTAGSSGKATAQMLRGTNPNKVSCHFVIDRDGTVYQSAELDQCCHHAGVSLWRGTSGLNRHWIGIENANWGYWRPGIAVKTADDARKEGWLEAQHKNGGPTLLWEPYPEVQVAANEKLCRWLLETFPTIEDIRGHDDVAPKRKLDVGPAFPMQRFLDLIIPDSMDIVGTFSVNTTRLNVRGGAGTNFQVIRTLERGAKVTVVQDAGDWSFVEDRNGQQGWVYDAYLTREPTVQVKAAASKKPAKRKRA